MSWWLSCWSRVVFDSLHHHPRSQLMSGKCLPTGYTKFMECRRLLIFWNFPLKKFPSSIFPSSNTMPHLLNFQCSIWHFQYQSGHEQNSHSFHIPIQIIMNHRTWGEIMGNFPLGHKWKLHVVHWQCTWKRCARQGRVGYNCMTKLVFCWDLH